MKLTKQLYLGAILACAAPLALAGPISVSNGGVTLTISEEGSANAKDAEQAFLDSLTNSKTEDFETYEVGEQTMVFNSSVGSFEVVTLGTGGACNNKGFSCAAGVAVLDSAASPFSGRFNTLPEDGSQWLDSMDARELKFTPNEGTTAIGFYMTDPNDAGGRFEINGVGFDFSDIFGSSLGNGKVFYLTLVSDSPITSFIINTNNRNDGYGIDGVSIAVPAPGTLALLGAGLLGLGILRRRRVRMS